MNLFPLKDILARKGDKLFESKLQEVMELVWQAINRKVELRKRTVLYSAAFTKLCRNQAVNLLVLLQIDSVMNCNADDMMNFVKDDIPVKQEKCYRLYMNEFLTNKEL